MTCWPASPVTSGLGDHGGENELVAFDTWLRTHRTFLRVNNGGWYERTLLGHRDRLCVDARLRAKPP
jgi:hypothetical protein